MRIYPKRLLKAVAWLCASITVLAIVTTTFLKIGQIHDKYWSYESIYGPRIPCISPSGRQPHPYGSSNNNINSNSESSSLVAVWPDDVDDDDRILNQLRYTPTHIRNMEETGDACSIPLKTIVVAGALGSWAKRGQGSFVEQQCQVSYCAVTDDRRAYSTADAVIHTDPMYLTPLGARSSNQIHIFFMLESPERSYSLTRWNGRINWTATYRRDSTIVAPYEKFVPYDNTNVLDKPLTRNYAKAKTKKIAWFVSNCNAENNRLEYARELGKFIQVDIYGACGDRVCVRSTSSECFDLLNTEYKFYLSFENGNCQDYITEKFFLNGLR
jgi:glycoprotein 3-alpha-L-fucosyltransferase